MLDNPKYEEEIIMAKMPMFNVQNKEMEKNIGKKVRYINPTCIVEHEEHVIKSLQKNYKGDIIYRIYRDDNDFGRPANPSDIEFIL